ncbi:hypothetical protein [Rhodoferax sp.]|uniref:hypothetical protein n=1 Tax=Rhodoferax sp. TaxID=50421 RepID=UPI0019D89895|nr:hypothetical protein [Rhodoferax sp.]MBE0472811.1 hypothetical protein [Rhodoferax sp.]
MSTPRPYLSETKAPARAEVDALVGLTLLEFGTIGIELGIPFEVTGNYNELAVVAKKTSWPSWAACALQKIIL